MHCPGSRSSRFVTHSRGYQMARKLRKESPWTRNFVSMGLKTVIRRFVQSAAESA